MASEQHDLFLPDYLEIIRNPDSIMIRRRWFSWRYIPPAIILLVVMVVFVPHYVTGVINQGSWIFLVVLAPPFLYVIYLLLTKLVNSSYLFINRDIIDINHRPLPYAASVRIPSTSIEKIYLEEKWYKGQSRRKYFELSVLTKSGTKLKLLSEIDIQEQASFIKKEIEIFFAL